jgi:hypothetical protein
MLIISFFNALNNQKAIESLIRDHDDSEVISFPDFKFKSDSHNKLMLISLNADGRFQMKIKPEVLTRKLLENGLPASVSEIEIIVSDIERDERLWDYALELGKAFLQAGREVTVKATRNIEGRTLVVPPEKPGESWRVYLLDLGLEDRTRDFNYYNSLSQAKTLIFEGKTIQDFLDENEEDCKITPKRISRYINTSAYKLV